MAAAGADVLGKRLAAAALAAAALALPAGAAQSASPLVDAYAKTAAADTAHLAMTGSVTTAGSTFPYVGRGELDNRTRRSLLDLDLSTAGGAIPGVNKKDLVLTMVFDAKPVVAYLRWPLLTKLLKSRKPWLRIDFKQLAGSTSQLGQLAEVAQSADIGQQLRLLQLATGPVAAAGKATIGGVATTHYRTTLQYRKLAHVLPQDARRALLKTGAKTAPLDVWVDADGYVRRLAYSYQAQSAQGRVGSKTTLEFSHFGEPVTVGLPRAAEVEDLAALTSGGKGG